jgi:hypothetical protein
MNLLRGERNRAHARKKCNTRREIVMSVGAQTFACTTRTMRVPNKANCPMETPKRVTGPRDRTRINMHEGFDVRYWSTELGVSAEQLKEITGKVGDNVEDVRKELASRNQNAWRA